MLEKLRFAHGESDTYEFKVQIPEKHEKFLKTAVAFANGKGGRLIFGVRDQTWEIIGIPPDEVSSARDAVANSIYDACSPHVVADVQVETVQGKSIIVVDVPPGVHKPYYIKKAGLIDGTYVRLGSETRHAGFETIQELLLEGTRYSYDELAQRDIDVSEEEAHALCARITEHARSLDYLSSEPKETKPLTVNQLLNWKLLYRRHQNGPFYPSNGFLLLDGRLDLFPYAYIQCAVFKGTDRRNFLDKKDIYGPIDQQVEDATSFVLEHISLGSRITGPQRQDFYELPVASVREMIANAVAHRSYLQRGCVQVALFDDRLEVTSPGQLSAELSVQELRQGYSRIRNEGIAAVFLYMHLIEKWGTGIPRIYHESELYGLGEPQITAGPSSFRIELFRRPFETDAYGVLDPAQRGTQPAESTAQSRPDQNGRSKQIPPAAAPLTDQQRLLDALRAIADEPKHTYSALSKQLHWTPRKVQYQMGQLVKLGLAARIGSNRSGKWVLTDAAARDPESS